MIKDSTYKKNFTCVEGINQEILAMSFTSVPCTIRYMNTTSESLASRLRRRRKELGLSQPDIAARMGVSAQAVQQWEKEGGTSPRGKRMHLLAQILQCSPEWLQFGSDQRTPDAVMRLPEGSNVAPVYFKEQKPYPVISWVQAGEWNEAVDMYSPGAAEEWEYTDCTVSDRAFWLKVKGDSMTAPVGVSIPEGHLILVDPDAAPENGSLVVAKLIDSDEATFKRLVIDGSMRYLKPLNPSYPVVTINGNCRIVGVVKEAKIRF
jgi:SOS-response transcriptional repressor LexA